MIGGETEGAELPPKSAGQSLGLLDSSPSCVLRDSLGGDLGRVVVSNLFLLSSEPMVGSEENAGPCFTGAGGVCVGDEREVGALLLDGEPKWG